MVIDRAGGSSLAATATTTNWSTNQQAKKKGLDEPTGRAYEGDALLA